MSETILGFDYGAARTGVAVAQLPEGIASPLTVLTSVSGNPDWRTISDLIREWRPTCVVVGVPLRMDGSESEMTRAARQFARRLSHRCGVTVEQADERLTSREAQDELREYRKSGAGKKKHAAKLDAIAARIMLEQWIAQRPSGNGAA